MDAATRAELDALRLRAYGPTADIAGDGAALERLVELEELALPALSDSPAPRPDENGASSPAEPDDGESSGAEPAEVPRPDENGASFSAEPAPALPSGAQLGSASGVARVVEVLPARARRPRSRRGWHVALVAAVALAVVPLGVTAASRTVADAVPSRAAGQIPASVRDALAFANDPRSQTLIQVRIDGSFGDYVDIAAGDDIPLFPVEGLMTWVEPLGDYYGWEVWIGGARGGTEDENCLVLDGGGTTRGSCVSTALKAKGGLLLTVPYADVVAEERPEAMTPDESLGFWWSPDGIVTILLGPTALLGMASAPSQGEGSAGRARPLAAESALGAIASDPGGLTPIRVLIDDDSGDDVDLSATPGVPAFPVNGQMKWAQPLGEYYGWALWIGGGPSAQGDVDCLLLEREADTRSRCVSVELKTPGALAMSVPYEQLAAHERPAGMRTDQSVTFWWGPGGFIAILLTAA